MADILVGFVGMSEAARALRISRERVRQLVKEGRLKALLTPYGLVIPEAEVERLIKERRPRQAVRA